MNHNINTNKIAFHIIRNFIIKAGIKQNTDSIESIINILNKRDEYECVELIKYYNQRGEFNNSISNVLNYIKSQEYYPEAEKLIGDIQKKMQKDELHKFPYRKILFLISI